MQTGCQTLTVNPTSVQRDNPTSYFAISKTAQTIQCVLSTWILNRFEVIIAGGRGWVDMMSSLFILINHEWIVPHWASLQRLTHVPCALYSHCSCSGNAQGYLSSPCKSFNNRKASFKFLVKCQAINTYWDSAATSSRESNLYISASQTLLSHAHELHHYCMLLCISLHSLIPN